MTTTDSSPPDYLRADKGVWSWLTTRDHKRIGLMYMVAVLTANQWRAMVEALENDELVHEAPAADIGRKGELLERYVGVRRA